jgi:hypothetical protein
MTHSILDERDAVTIVWIPAFAGMTECFDFALILRHPRESGGTDSRLKRNTL